MISETLYIDRGKGRESSVNEALDFLMRLPQDKRFALEVEQVRDRLPRNLMARLKIPTRALAKHMDLTYEQMVDVIHDKLYPKRLKTIAGVEYAVFVPSNQLTPDEARQIEVDLYNLMADCGCPLDTCNNWSIPSPTEEQAA